MLNDQTDNLPNNPDDADRSERIIELYSAALELPPEARAAYLAKSCAGDEALRREVEELLAYKVAAEDSAKPDLGTSAIALAARQLAEEQKQNAAQHIGAAIPAGMIIHQYRILRRHGAGGMGEVYLAEDTRLKRTVAIKVLAADSADNADRVRRFEQEALAISALRHPNIVTIHDTLQHERLHLIVTEFVEGETLRQVIAGAALDWREAVRIAEQIASALTAAHAAGIVHRDIKPENAVRQRDGLVKVLDFGIAKHIRHVEQTSVCSGAEQTEVCSTPSAQSQTKTGNIFGTVNYMSPEQARGEREIDARTDIFSLGVLLFELLAQRRPFSGVTTEEKIAALLSRQEAPDVREFCPDIPAALAVLIAKATRKDRAQRYDTAGEMLAELQELHSQIEATDLERVQQSLKKQNATRLLSQFTVLYLKNERVRLPMSRLATVWWAADLPRGKPEKALLRKSVIRILLRFGRAVLALALATVLLAYMSISQQWEARPIRDGHTKAVHRAAFSPDGKLLVTGGNDSLAIVWDVAGRRRLATIDNHGVGILAVAFSPDGRHFATGADDALTTVWEVIAHQAANQVESIRLEKVAELPGQSSSVAALAFSPDGERLVSVSHDQRNYDIHVSGQTIIWETKRWRKLRELKIGNGWGVAPIFLDNQRLFICGEVWNVESGEVLDNKNQVELERIAALSPDGKVGIGLGGCCYVGFWRMSPPEQLRRLLAHQFIGRSAAISHNGRWAATGAENIVFWDMKTMEQITSHKHNDNVWDLKFSPDDRWLVSTHGDGSVLVWDAKERRLVADFAGHSGNINSVDFSPDGKRFVTAGDDRSILLWNAATGLKEGALNGHEIAVKKVKFLDSNRLVSEDILGNLFFWDIAERRYENGCRQAKRCNTVSISPDGRWMVSSSQVIDLGQNRQALNFESVLGNGIDAAAFSADGKWLAVVQVGMRNLFLWDTTTWQVANQIKIREIDVIRMVFSPDGSQLALGGNKGEVALMNVHPLAPVATLGGHQNHVQAITFSPDGKLIATASDDTTVGVWEVERLRLAERLAHNAPVLSVAFSLDGKQLITVGQDETVRRFTPYRAIWGWRLD